ncbi:UNKNOWN [Stylonychia lemnae]|uniref:Uncharacterized protein n=1 Tax=Stylonychia lemnae TaxID=5949 RepID=A0A078A9V1_STYLE|nr:UNKNOWN [Stylonychia lemnae]|eukprot:CDW78959.1 UNKNOWN [Stylonychia lemnae]
MRKIALALAVVAFASLTQASSWAKYGDAYEKLSAQDKQKALWAEITSNDTPYGWYNALELGGLFVESMSTSLHWVGDTFEDGWLGVRDKYIHSVGSVATVKYTPVDNNEGYTGIFKSGADHGLIRLSIAKQPDQSESKHSAEAALDNFTPGFGLKFLRNNVPSGNLVAMYSVNGAKSWNFFRMDFTNHIPDAEGVALTLVAKKFETATPFVQYVGLSDIASYEQDGTLTTTPKFPFQLSFEPVLREKFTEDFSQDFQEQLASIQAGSQIYKVHAYAEPDSQKVHIGDLSITSPLVKSYFGDRYLFFKHQDIQEDIVFRPEWKSHYRVASKSSCPFSSIKNAAKGILQSAKKFMQ